MVPTNTARNIANSWCFWIRRGFAGQSIVYDASLCEIAVKWHLIYNISALAQLLDGNFSWPMLVLSVIGSNLWINRQHITQWKILKGGLSLAVNLQGILLVSLPTTRTLFQSYYNLICQILINGRDFAFLVPVIWTVWTRTSRIHWRCRWKVCLPRRRKALVDQVWIWM